MLEIPLEWLITLFVFCAKKIKGHRCSLQVWAAIIEEQKHLMFSTGCNVGWDLRMTRNSMLPLMLCCSFSGTIFRNLLGSGQDEEMIPYFRRDILRCLSTCSCPEMFQIQLATTPGASSFCSPCKWNCQVVSILWTALWTIHGSMQQIPADPWLPYC